MRSLITRSPGIERAYGRIIMSCPRGCGVDVREHQSTDLLPWGNCDTDEGRTAAVYGQIRAWMTRHGLLDRDVITAADIVAARDADHDTALKTTP